MSLPASSAVDSDVGFQHEAFLYDGDAEFLAGTVPFLRAAVAADEPALVAVGPARIDRLRSALGADSSRVQFADMRVLGANPAHIIPAWRQFLDRHGGAGRPVRGIGEPIWAGRSGAELAECQLHELLLNVAFDGGPGWRLLCPYDIAALSPDVIDVALDTHPLCRDGDGLRPSLGYRVASGLPPLTGPLPEPGGRAEVVEFDRHGVPRLRELVTRLARAAGLRWHRVDDLVLAVHEVATNSVRHGGGGGVFRLWVEAGRLVCDVQDRGYITNPLVGRERPAVTAEGGRGLWLANQLCDLVQVRSSVAGTTVRLHLAF